MGAVLYLALLVATIAVGGAAMYYMWRDIAGPGEAPAAVAARTAGPDPRTLE
jgi:hypothetical protein